MKDKEDLALEALFRSEPIADGGFSRKVTARIRRRIWLRRLALPVAMGLGALIAFRPALEVLRSLYGLVNVLPENLRRVPLDMLPQLPTIAVVAAVVVAALIFVPAVED